MSGPAGEDLTPPGAALDNRWVIVLGHRDGRSASPFGLARAGKRRDLGSTPLRLFFLFKKVVVCGHLSCDCPLQLMKH